MDKMQYEKIAELERSQAEVVESFLEAEGIDVELIEESVWRSSYSTSFHDVQVFVPKAKVKQARELLKSFDIEQEEDDKE